MRRRANCAIIACGRIPWPANKVGEVMVNGPVPKWLQGEVQANQSVCPGPLLPTYDIECGGVQWPDVCRCPVNGGPAFELHELQANCVAGVEQPELEATVTVNGVPEPPITWVCTCPNGAEHLPNCPFDNCPIGTCHPMCAQVVGGTHVIGHVSGEALYCRCPCHG